jgi:hypothetical protein
VIWLSCRPTPAEETPRGRVGLTVS